jgi:hypothetical protein
MKGYSNNRLCADIVDNGISYSKIEDQYREYYEQYLFKHDGEEELSFDIDERVEYFDGEAKRYAIKAKKIILNAEVTSSTIEADDVRSQLLIRKFDKAVLDCGFKSGEEWKGDHFGGSDRSDIPSLPKYNLTVDELRKVNKMLLDIGRCNAHKDALKYIDHELKGPGAFEAPKKTMQDVSSVADELFDEWMAETDGKGDWRELISIGAKKYRIEGRPDYEESKFKDALRKSLRRRAQNEGVYSRADEHD